MLEFPDAGSIEIAGKAGVRNLSRIAKRRQTTMFGTLKVIAQGLVMCSPGSPAGIFRLWSPGICLRDLRGRSYAPAKFVAPFVRWAGLIIRRSVNTLPRAVAVGKSASTSRHGLASQPGQGRARISGGAPYFYSQCGHPPS